MYPFTTSYLKGLTIIFVFLVCSGLYAQEEKTEVGDTTLLHLLLRGPEWQENLNYSLMNSAAKGDTLSIRWLLNYGAEIDASTVENITPLLFAIANNRKDAVKVLLEYGPKIDYMSSFWDTPLIVAVKNQNLEIAEILIRDSADINMPDKFGATPLHYASIYGYFYITDMLLYYEAAVFKKSNDGVTPLMAAVWAGYADIADLLIQNGANPEDSDNLGFTPFLLAAQNGDTVIMDLLLKRRVDIYEKNSYNYNALDLAIKSNSSDAVEYLLRKGNRWTEENRGATDPYSVAASYSRKEIATLLQKYNISRARKFGFDQVSFTGSARLHFHDYYTGFSISTKEPLLNAGIVAGIDIKPTYTRILIRESDNIYYQYYDKSSVFYAGLFKEFLIKDNPLNGSLSVRGSLTAAYTFGNKLKGTGITPENKIQINPGVGLIWNKDAISILGCLEYLSTEFYKVGPVWLRLGASFSFFSNNSRAPGKIIKWY